MCNKYNRLCLYLNVCYECTVCYVVFILLYIFSVIILDLLCLLLWVASIDGRLPPLAPTIALIVVQSVTDVYLQGRSLHVKFG